MIGRFLRYWIICLRLKWGEAGFEGENISSGWYFEQNLGFSLDKMRRGM